MATYTKCPKEVLDLLRKVMEKHHPHLAAFDVNVACVFAYAKVNNEGIRVGCAVTCGGYQALAKIRVLNLKDRALGRGDAEIVIDGDQFPDFTEARQRALLDHELEHLEVVWEVTPPSSNLSAGVPETDDAGRPKLRLRKHDWQIGGFKAVAQRHGDDSFERSHAKYLVDEYGQYLFDFAAGPDAGRVAVRDAAAKFVKGIQGLEGVESVTLSASTGPSVTIPVKKRPSRQAAAAMAST